MSKDESCSLKILDAPVYTAAQPNRILFQEANDNSHSATARAIEEARRLEVGFEYVCHHEGVMLLTKGK